MAARSTTFFEFSKEIAEDFLQTVIIVDDGADYPSRTPRPHVGLERPQESPLKGQTPKTTHSANQEEKREDREDISHRLDAKAVIDSFSHKGIICSVFLVEEEDRENLTQTVYNLASCADIVVLDWALQKDDGEKAIEIIEELVKQMLSEPSQLRLIVVYSGTPDIRKISEEIKKALRKLRIPDIVEFDDGFALETGFTKIVVFAKKETMVLPEYENRIVSFDELSDRLTKEFTMMTAGLVSNAVLKSLAQVRKNTPKILKNFSKGLDAPYLTHRALLSTPDDAKDHLILLVAQELQAILEEAQIGEVVNLDAIKAWVENKQKTEFQLEHNITFSTNELIELIGQGVGKSDRMSTRNPHKKPITRMLHGEDDGLQFLDEKFSFFTTMRSYYKQRKPKLTLGTVLKSESKEAEFWLCIQPRCDCLRIKALRAFPFLPLQTKGKNEKFDTVLYENDKYIRLHLITKPFEIRLISFKPDPEDEEVVTAKEQEGSYYFTDSEGKKYKWMGELRFEHAQRISNEFAANISRVGLDESEWLRLWKTKG